MTIVTIGKGIINLLRGRGYKSVNAVAPIGIYTPIQPKSQEEAPQRPVRHPRRKARLLLARYGIGDILTQDDVNKIFWEMSIRRKPVPKNVINAVHVTIDDNKLMKSFNRKLELYNEFMQAKVADPNFMDTEEELKAEVIKLKQSLAREQKEKNSIKQKLEQEEGVGRRFAKKFINQLKIPNSKFHQIYDFTKEEDIEEFLSWFKLLKHQVAKRTIKGIVRNRLTDEGSQELFVSMVEAHNSLFLPDPEEIEWKNENTNI